MRPVHDVNLNKSVWKIRRSEIPDVPHANPASFPVTLRKDPTLQPDIYETESVRAFLIHRLPSYLVTNQPIRG